MLRLEISSVSGPKQDPSGKVPTYSTPAGVLVKVQAQPAPINNSHFSHRSVLICRSLTRGPEPAKATQPERVNSRM